MGRPAVPCWEMRSRWSFLTSVNTMRSAPDFDVVARLGEAVAVPKSGVVAEMFAAMDRDCLVTLDDANLVNVHAPLLYPVWGSCLDAARACRDF